MQGDGVDINVVNDDTGSVESGVAHSDLLCALVDSVVKGTDEEVAKARDKVVDTMEFEALVDSVAVIGNFERMNRIGFPCENCGQRYPRPIGTEQIRERG